jgi:5-methylcytosine-specific restriction endonuclease McrA
VTTSRWCKGWDRIRLAVLERDGYRCTLNYSGCQGRATHVDHVLPRRFGGGDELANLRAACRLCNQRRGAGTRPVGGDPVSAW